MHSRVGSSTLPGVQPRTFRAGIRNQLRAAAFGDSLLPREGNVMKAWSCAPALVLLALAAPAEAKGVAWCQVNGAKYEAYLSGIVEVDDGPQAFKSLVSGPFGKGFQDYVRGSLDPRASGLDCTRQESLFYAQD